MHLKRHGRARLPQVRLNNVLSSPETKVGLRDRGDWSVRPTRAG